MTSRRGALRGTWCLAALFLSCASPDASAQAIALESELAQLDQTISDLVDVQMALDKPDALLVPEAFVESEGGSHLVVARRDRVVPALDAVLASAEARAERKARLLYQLEEVTRQARAMIVTLLQEKSRRRDEIWRLLAAGTPRTPAATSWTSFTGQGLGRFDMVCRTASGDFPSSGGATFELKLGTVTGNFAGGSFSGVVAEDGSASGRGQGPFGSVQWWGRFRRASNGVLEEGQGSINPLEGEAQCTGTWSIP